MGLITRRNFINAQVRERDAYRCVECGMSRAEHLDRFGKDLSVHRFERSGRYEAAKCETLCMSCCARKPKTPMVKVTKAFKRRSQMQRASEYAGGG